MSAHVFEVGETVYSRGMPPMVVTGMTDTGKISVLWREGCEVIYSWFQPSDLTKTPPPLGLH